jgi:phospholipid/cholesterol/gamma-HCH transport system ATP-binding protein
MIEPLIEFKNVSKAFGQTSVLDGVNLSIYKGETTTIIGKSGVGKSVLLKHMVGLLEQDSGEILFKGSPLSSMKSKEKKSFRERFSYMFQGTALFDSMTVMENIVLPLEEKRKTSRKDLLKKAREKMTQLDIQEIGDKYPSQISGGMKKRVALARALITDPEIVLFDEPTTGLDPIRKSAVHSMIDEYQRKFGFTAIMVSHEIPDIFFISNRIAMLDQGKILFQGNPDQFQKSDEPAIREFLQVLETNTDNLTGLSHRVQGERRFKEAVERLKRFASPFTIVLLTVENLSELDSKMGHEASHAALKNLSFRVEGHVRVTDTCSRYGMNKIMIILADTDIDQANQVCERMIKELENTSNDLIKPYPGFCFSLSVGMAQVKKDSRMDEVMALVEKTKNIVQEFNVC